MTTDRPKIEHSGNAVYAIHTPEGPAIYPALADLIDAVLDRRVVVSDGDREYYDGREWREVRPEDLTDLDD